MNDSYRPSRGIGPWIALLLAAEAVAACSTSAPTTGPAAATGLATALASQSPTAAISPSPAPPTTRPIPAGLLLFDMQRGDGSSANIAYVRTDGSGFGRITNDPARLYRDPTWDAANQRIVYSDERSTSVHLYWMTPDGLQRTQITSGTLFDGDPAVVDAQTIVFDRGSDSVTSVITAIHLDALWRRWSTHPPKAPGPGDIQPSVSGDGKQIAFVRNGALEVVAAFGDKPQELVPASYHADRPRWSPDGRLIVFGGADGLAYLVATSKGDKPRQIEPQGWLMFQPSFSPDGQWLVATFFFRESGYSGLGVMPVAGGPPTMIFVNDSDSEGPWAPIWIPADQATVFAP